MTGDESCEQFLNCVQDNFFSQHIRFPTHSSGSQPDIILSSQPELVLDVEDVCRLGKSDHSMVMASIAGKVSSNTTFELVPDWRKANLDALRELTDINWEERLAEKNTLETWDSIKAHIHEVEGKCVPRKRRRIASRPLWMQQNVLRTIRKKRRLWSTYQQSREYEEYLAYKKVEKEVRQVVRAAKKKFEKSLAKEAKKKPKQFYAYLKSRTSNRQSIGPLKNGSEVCSDNKSMAGILNSFFTSVFTQETLPVPEISMRNSGESLSEVQFSTEKVEAKVDALKPDSAAGPDNITARYLKETANVLSLPLSIVFKRSLDEGVVPDDWRRGNITPIFKSGSKMSPGNYRPVYLTCIICKIMESIIRDDIVQHLSNHHLIHASQHGFTYSKSCQTNLLEYLNTLTKLVDEGHNIDVLYLDFAKAFDKVPHQRLLRKLEAYGIAGKVLAWIESWLTGRMQRVVLNGVVSDWDYVSSGVPQGSVLGPTCFVVFIDDLDEVVDLVNGFIYKFADDTKYGKTVVDEADREQMQQCIDKLLEWADNWQMEFNSSKCKILHVGNTNPRFTYTMGGYAPGGALLESVEKEKDIGVLIHESLKPSYQCAKAAAKANAVLGQMSRAFHYRDKFVWLRLYKTFVRPHLEFAVQAWSPWLKGDIELLEKVQRRALGMVKGLRGVTYAEKLKEVGMYSLYDRRVRGDMIQIWKVIHGQCILDSSMLQLAGTQHSRTTRHTSKALNLARIPARLDVRRHFFSVRSVEIWNNLPSQLQAIDNLDQFKSGYDELML